MFCQGLEEYEAGHTRRQCPLFRQVKKLCSRAAYIDIRLRRNDADGYAAAGVLPWRRASNGGIELLLAREYRKPSHDRGGDKLNFLGGKREKQETKALVCAVDKVYQETGGKLSPTTVADMRNGCPLVCWSSDSKYVLFVHELVGKNDCEIDVQCVGVAGTKHLEWVTREEALSTSWTSQEMHLYALEILDQLTSCSIMKHLEKLFDVAKRPSNSPVTPATKGSNIDEVQELLSRLSMRP
jgi:8-oxo-dGTP pyrophosphatase MutT (NUDIX family)